MVEVKLPEAHAGLRASPRRRRRAATRPHPLQKFLNADFAKGGSDAAKFLKNFKWTTEDQNEVAGDDRRARRWSRRTRPSTWVKANKSTWQKWIPKK